MLTKKQHELLLFIHQVLSSTGVPPSFDEMKEALKLRSKSGIHRLITGLEERGFIRRLPHRARAIEITRLPDNLESDAPAPSPGPAAPNVTPATGFSPNVIKGNFGSALGGSVPAESSDAMTVALARTKSRFRSVATS